VDWLKFVQVLWPILGMAASLVSLTVILWLRTQFPTKTDLKSTEADILAKIDAHQDRLDEGSKKLADLGNRVSVVEADCESSPSKNDLNQGLAVVAGRVSGLEASVRGVETQVKTQNGYLQTLIEQGLRK
jgi:hypothetical protein